MSEAGELEGALSISGSHLQFFANDRLTAPNTEATYRELAPALQALLQRLFAGVPYSLQREADPRERLSVRVRSQSDVPLRTLLERLN
jgi:hypothetical protein